MKVRVLPVYGIEENGMEGFGGGFGAGIGAGIAIGIGVGANSARSKVYRHLRYLIEDKKFTVCDESGAALSPDELIVILQNRKKKAEQP